MSSLSELQSTLSTSRQALAEFAVAFRRNNDGRRPQAEDFLAAGGNTRVHFKNYMKIKNKIGNVSKTNKCGNEGSAGLERQLSFEGVFDKKSKDGDGVKSCNNDSNNGERSCNKNVSNDEGDGTKGKESDKIARKSGTKTSRAWGNHVCKANLNEPDSDKRVSLPSFSCTLKRSESEVRSSLRRKRRKLKDRRSSSFFDTMGDTDTNMADAIVTKNEGLNKENNVTQRQQTDANVDPLSQLLPEISMDESLFKSFQKKGEKIDDQMTNNHNLAKENDIGDLSFLGTVFGSEFQNSFSFSLNKAGGNSKSTILNSSNCDLKRIRSIDSAWLDRCSDEPRTRVQDESSESLCKGQDQQVLKAGDHLRGGEVTQTRDKATTSVGAESKNDRKDKSSKENTNLAVEKSASITRAVKVASTTPGATMTHTAMPEEPGLFASDTECAENNTKQGRGRAKRKRARFSSSLEDKLKSGRANENYVRIDVSKRRFVRANKGNGAAKFRRSEWKRKLAVKEKSCSTRNYEDDPSLKLENECEKEEQLLSLSEVAALQVERQRVDALFSERFETNEGKLNEVNQESDEKMDDGLNLSCSSRIEFTDDLIFKHLTKDMGFRQFRPGQLESIKRILSGQSTLSLMPTGFGKSLIYQLSAYLMHKFCDRAMAIVISPLVSLMEDQVSQLPKCIKAACMHSQLSEKVKEQIWTNVKEKSLHFLLIAPESLFSLLSKSFASHLPKISFVCIDEVHCLSQWSHNFRPTYLTLPKIIKRKLGVNVILGLTATATKTNTGAIAEALAIDTDTGVIRGDKNIFRDQVTLSVSVVDDKEAALLKLLKTPKMEKCHSIIIYCLRRETCDNLATLIRTHFQERDMSNEHRLKGRKKVSYTSESYHAGLSGAKRRSIQNLFMSNKLRIVVATVAFGMGVDKSDLRAVIHFNLPATFENYVQEVGRAGRDGESAHCHLLLQRTLRASTISNSSSDEAELRRHIFANAVDAQCVRKLLNIVFENYVNSQCDNDKVHDDGVKHDFVEHAIEIATSVEALDLPEENIATLLCYLENYKDIENTKYVELLNNTYAECTIHCYKGADQMKSLIVNSKHVEAAFSYLRRHKPETALDSRMTFPIVAVASSLGWSSGLMKRDLRRLQWRFNEGTQKWERSGISVQFSKLAFNLRINKSKMNEDKVDAMHQYLMHRVTQRENREITQLKQMSRAFELVATDIEDEEERVQANCQRLKGFIQDHFDKIELDNDQDVFDQTKPECVSTDKADIIRSDVRELVSVHSDQLWTGRAVARVFLGISSPNYPAERWGRVKRFWRKHLHENFHALNKIANAEILAMRRGKS